MWKSSNTSYNQGAENILRDQWNSRKNCEEQIFKALVTYQRVCYQMLGCYLLAKFSTLFCHRLSIPIICCTTNIGSMPFPSFCQGKV